jgi:hypothetical protein
VIAVRVLVFLAGVLFLVSILRAVIRTFVVPRGEQVLSARLVFLWLRPVFDGLASRRRDPVHAHAVRARYAPTALVGLAAVWAAGVLLAFVPMYWATGGISVRDAFRLSGSSLTTLGFVSSPNDFDTALAVTEALIGLGLVAMLIAYLPTIYANFARREAEVLKLEVRAGAPPSPATFLIRLHAIGWNDRFEDIWADWEQWFTELEESHTSQPSIGLFRSQRHENSWVTASCTVLDSAALSLAALAQPGSPQANLTLRSGFLALRAIAEFFGAPLHQDPRPDDPISVTREEFDELLDRLAASGVALKSDRDQAWRDYAGWRVNYDEAVLALCALLRPAPAMWSSDRSILSRRRHPCARGVGRSSRWSTVSPGRHRTVADRQPRRS